MRSATGNRYPMKHICKFMEIRRTRGDELLFHNYVNSPAHLSLLLQKQTQ